VPSGLDLTGPGVIFFMLGYGKPGRRFCQGSGQLIGGQIGTRRRFPAGAVVCGVLLRKTPAQRGASDWRGGQPSGLPRPAAGPAGDGGGAEAPESPVRPEAGCAQKGNPRLPLLTRRDRGAYNRREWKFRHGKKERINAAIMPYTR
jgi:hypothetical protein